MELLPCMLLLGFFVLLFGWVFFFPFSQFLCEIPGPNNVVLQARAKLSVVCAGFIK